MSGYSDNQQKKYKTGLFFGSFNPIHIGHTAIANYMVEYGPVQQIWFVVTPLNPLKKRSNLLDDYQRLELVNRAIGNDHRFLASDIEFRLPQPNYTIDTLVYMKEKHPQRDFYLIMGADNYVTFKKWKNWEILANDFKFLVYPRPGFDHTKISLTENFELIDAPVIEISSTFIRKAIAEGKDVRYFLSPEVNKYIDEMGFYR
ncbi:MAG TPA: nicotinate (nicotinamide) nucleotide adenylyltransferase [Prolixibacteraceae bacterium]|nr:nicotinate (nicotinamide) nucleotide adenylyltransferase [Prolixibacteraceae bacterium]